MVVTMSDHTESGGAPEEKGAKTGETDSESVENASELRDSESAISDKLDFYSHHFDPLLALNTSECVPPVQQAKLFDNLAMFDAHLKRLQTGGASTSGPGKKSKLRMVDKEMVETVRRFQPHQMPIVKPRKQCKTILDRMENASNVLQVLARARKDELQVIVTTRHAHGIRGVCIGHLTLFDKFWNLTLRDVDELWIRRKRARVPAIGDAAGKSKYFERLFPRTQVLIEELDGRHPEGAMKQQVAKFRKLLATNAFGANAKNSELCQRRIRELLIRGEQIVFVAGFSE